MDIDWIKRFIYLVDSKCQVKKIAKELRISVANVKMHVYMINKYRKVILDNTTNKNISIKCSDKNGDDNRLRTLVVMPCFNASATVIESLNSIINQSYKEFMLVVCDDKSTDNTLTVIEKYHSAHSSEFVIEKNNVNLGTGETVSNMINKHLATHPYEFITWISADNTINKYFIDKHMQCLDSGCAVSYSSWNMMGNKKGKYKQSNPVDFARILINRYGVGPSFMFRKWVWEEVKPFHKLPGEDWNFFVKCAIVNAKFMAIEDDLVSYRYHDNSVSGRLRKRMITATCSEESKTLSKKLIGIKNGVRIYE